MLGMLCFAGCVQVKTAINVNQITAKTTQEENKSLEVSATPDASSKRNFHDEVPVLMFHYVREVDRSKDPIGYNLSITPDKFEKLLEFLQKNKYHTIHVADLEKEPIPSKSIVLTFDDGYEDFYTTAIPLLKKYGFTASNAVIVNFIGRPDYMTAEQIKQINDDGFEILSHSMNHKDMSVTPTAEYEITQSKIDLEKLIGKTIIAFVYPSGKYNNKSQEYVKNAGYRFAFTTKPGDANLDKDPYTMDRIRVDNRVLLTTLAKELEN